MATTEQTLTPKELATELGISPKVLRGYLRKQHTRNAEVKGQAWVIPSDVADAAREKFAQNRAASSDDS